MDAYQSLIPDLEDAISHGSSDRRLETLRRVTDLFLGNASRYSEQQVALFDEVITEISRGIETIARAELAGRLAPVGSAPIKVIRMLAHDDEISVAGPVLGISPRLDETELVSIAETRSQQHLLTISLRAQLGEAVTDVLVVRGDQSVVQSVARNRGARFSNKGFSTLVDRAATDHLLAQYVGLRRDLPTHHLRQLLIMAGDLVRDRLLLAADPESFGRIQDILVVISEDLQEKLSEPRDYAAAKISIELLMENDQLDEAQLRDFAVARRFEETVAALSRMCNVPVEIVDRLLADVRIDPIVILTRAVSFSWKTVRAVIGLRPGNYQWTAEDFDKAEELFNKLSEATARRVIRFWQVRKVAGRSGSAPRDAAFAVLARQAAG